MSSGIEIEGNGIKIDIDKILDAMSEDDCALFIKSFAVQETVIRHVIDYICDDDEDGWWHGNSPEWRHEILLRVEKRQLEHMPTHSWRVWDDVRQALKNIRSNQEVYWKLYHCEDDGVKRWLMESGLNSNYTTEEADKDVERIENLVRDAFNKMKEELK